MKSNKHLATLAIASIAMVALFTGCNKNGIDNRDLFTSNSNKDHKTQVYSSPVPLGTAATFAVLGGESVSNATTSVITGDLGVSPGTSITGFDLTENTIVGSGVTDGLGIVNGTIYSDGPVAAQAHMDAIVAYNYLMAQTPDTLPYGDVYQLAGRTFKPGVYNFPSSANLQVGGTLKLDFGGDPDALFIFQMSTETLVAMADSKVMAINTGNSDCLSSNVFWAVGSSATIDGAEFIGTVIAYTTITMTSAANTIVSPSLSPVTNVSGRMLALHGEVTMVNSIISTCGTVSTKVHPKPAGDWFTGGGFININDVKATFGVSGGIKNGKFWGQLEYNDHNGVQVKSIEVTNYTVIDAVTRQIDGNAKINGEDSFAYTVVVSDNGEPGTNDSFSIVLSTGYSASGTLNGGNIQLHVK